MKWVFQKVSRPQGDFEYLPGAFYRFIWASIQKLKYPRRGGGNASIGAASLLSSVFRGSIPGLL
jgi:hypothetical protein